MKDRSVHVDLALAFAATFVVTLALWPQSQPRQVVHCRKPDGGWKTYSIAVNDPSLAEIKSRLYRWSTPEFDRRYATAKWQLEVARFYQSAAAAESDNRLPSLQVEGNPLPTTFRFSDTVATVSFELPAGEASLPAGEANLPAGEANLPAGEAGSVKSAGYIEPLDSVSADAVREAGLDNPLQSPAPPTDPRYWAKVIESAEQSIAATLRRTQNAPVVLDDVRPAGWAALAFHSAILFGLLAACGYMHWLRVAPRDSRLPLAEQRPMVFARLGTFTGLISLSLACLLTLWI